MTRVPYLDRPEVITRHCSCPRDAEGEIERAFIPRRDEYGHEIARTWYRLVDADCPLHGRDADAAPF